MFTDLGPITEHLDTEHRVFLQLARRDTGLLECLPLDELVTAPQGCLLREPLAMEPPVEVQTSMVV